MIARRELTREVALRFVDRNQNVVMLARGHATLNDDDAGAVYPIHALNCRVGKGGRQKYRGLRKIQRVRVVAQGKGSPRP